MFCARPPFCASGQSVRVHEADRYSATFRNIRARPTARNFRRPVYAWRSCRNHLRRCPAKGFPDRVGSACAIARVGKTVRRSPTAVLRPALLCFATPASTICAKLFYIFFPATRAFRRHIHVMEAAKRHIQFVENSDATSAAFRQLQRFVAVAATDD